MFLLVGLGNPEDKYANTRHNLGFEVIEELASKLGESVKGKGERWENKKEFKAQILKLDFTLNASPFTLTLAKPQTYMNLSGMAVSLISKYYKISNTGIVVVHDDLDLPLGKIKVRLGGSAAGHHGVESIINSLGTDKFVRIRLGIGNLSSQSSERGGQSVNIERFVLEPFMRSEKSTVKRMVKQAVKALDIYLKEGLEKAQNQFN